MNRERLAQILKRLHPDRQGNNRHVDVVRRAIALYQRDRKERLCRCGSGKTRVSKHCRMCALKIRNRGRLKLAAAFSSVLLFAIGIFAAPITNFYEPGTIKLQWDASTGSVAGYRLYAHTNSIASTNLSSTLVKLDAGTNLTATVSALAAGTWYFAATAYTTNGTESALSNTVIASVPSAPPNMRTVILQWNATVTGTNWLDAGYFRVLFGP